MSSGDDWDVSDSEPAAPAQATASSSTTLQPVAAVRKSKFADEDADVDVKDSWEDSDEEKPVTPSGPAPPVRQKGITKAKIAEKEAAEKAKMQALLERDQEDPAARRARELAQQMQQDLENAQSLFGESTISESTGGNPLTSVPNPRTKQDYDALAENIAKAVVDLYGAKPLFPGFVESLCRALNVPLKDLDVKKVASTLSALGNEKQQAAKGPAKKGKKGKPSLGTVAGGGGGAKTAVAGRGYSADLARHDEAMDDDYDDDFM